MQVKGFRNTKFGESYSQADGNLKTTKDVSTTLKKQLNKNAVGKHGIFVKDLDREKLRGQCYDGCSTMMREKERSSNSN